MLLSIQKIFLYFGYIFIEQKQKEYSKIPLYHNLLNWQILVTSYVLSYSIYQLMLFNLFPSSLICFAIRELMYNMILKFIQLLYKRILAVSLSYFFRVLRIGVSISHICIHASQGKIHHQLQEYTTVVHDLLKWIISRTNPLTRVEYGLHISKAPKGSLD